jgi:hypothetical protein
MAERIKIMISNRCNTAIKNENESGVKLSDI